MEADDGLDDEGPLFAWIPPDDRLWRHPSESTAGAPPSPSPRSALHFGSWRISSGRTWGVAVVAGVVGALLASGVGMMTGTFEQRTTVVQPVRVMTPGTAAFADAHALGADWPSITDR
ncbi:MAG: hypothetical protein M3R71_04515, partial [Actinomycetota bacterium]|nr:hypothetical protein [Actinomycetota bacterium]